MTRGTYSFIVCRLCRFPLRVRYMPRSISGGPPHPGAREGMQEALLGSCLPPRPGGRRAATVRAAAEQSLRSQPEDWTPRHRLGWDSDRRSQEMGGTRTGSEKKNIPPGQPRQGSRERGMCLQGVASGARPGRKPDPVICDWPPPLPWQHQGKEEKTSQQIAGREEEREGKKALYSGWQGWLFLAKNYF